MRFGRALFAVPKDDLSKRAEQKRDAHGMPTPYA